MEWIVWALWAYAVAALHGVALWRARGRGQLASPAAGAPLPSHVLIRPVAGQDAELYAALMSVGAAPEPPAQIVHLVARGDRAAAMAHRACAGLREMGLQASTHLTQPACAGDNPKVAQLEQKACDAEFAVYADCCVDLSGLRLGELLAPLREDAGLGAVWLPTYEAMETTLAQRANGAVRTASLHALLFLGQLDRQLLAGGVVAVRLAALRQVGGWAALRTQLGEDMALGRRLRRCGWRSTMLPQPLPILRGDLGRWRSVLARYGRWLWVIRAQRPLLLASYPLLFCAALPLAALPFVAAAAPLWARLGGMALLAARLLVAGWGRRLHSRAGAAALGRPKGWALSGRIAAWIAALAAAALDSLLADLLLALALCRCLCSRHIDWGGLRLQMGKGGHLKGSPTPRARPPVRSAPGDGAKGRGVTPSALGRTAANRDRPLPLHRAAVREG